MSTSRKYWFDHKAANKYCRFIEKHLRLTKGKKRGHPFKLERWQRRIVRRLFGWKRQDGTRRYRRAWIEIPRKNGKSEFAAAIALALLLIDGEGAPEIYCAAVDEEQARVVFERAGIMAATSQSVSKKVEVLQKVIFCEQNTGSLKPLTSKAATKHGRSPSGAIYDEVHEMPNGDLVDVIHKGTAARVQPLEIYITTAGVKGDNFACEHHDYAVEVKQGRIDDDALFVAIFAAEEEDDWRDPEVWFKANPNLGICLEYSYIETECKIAELSPSKENDFRRYHLNQWTSQSVRWLPMLKWDLCSDFPKDKKYWLSLQEQLLAGAFRKRIAFGGLDLAQSSDFTAFVLVMPPMTEAERWVFMPWFWLPREALNSVSTVQKRRYLAFEKQGALTMTAGDVTDYGYVQEQVFSITELVEMKTVGYDRYNASSVVQFLQNKGVRVEDMPQGIPTMGPPSKEFERLVKGKMMEHGSHPVLRWMADNVEVIPDINNNIMPRKGLNEKSGRKNNKIDGISASVMGVGQVMANPGPRTMRYQKGSLAA